MDLSPSTHRIEYPAVFNQVYLGLLPDVYFAPFLSPIATAVLPKDHFSIIRAVYEDDEWCTPDIEGAFVRSFERRGAANMMSSYFDNYKFSPASGKVIATSSEHWVNYHSGEWDF